MLEIPVAMLLGFAFLLGAVVGSFLGVVVYRVPQGKSIMGRSFCPSCENQIAAYDNIPILSWVLLGGKCRKCNSRIPIQSPLEELATALLFVLSAYIGGFSILTLLLFYFAAISVALTLIDWKTLTLPDSIVKPSWIVVGIGVVAYAFTQPNPSDILLVSLVCTVAAMLFYFVIWLVTLGLGLGWGDVKLAPILAAVMSLFGWPAVLVGTAAAWVLGAVFGVLGLLLGYAKRGKPVPFGPFLIVGAWIGIVFHAPVSDAYKALAGL